LSREGYYNICYNNRRPTDAEPRNTRTFVTV
jgi:hypothetical protein